MPGRQHKRYKKRIEIEVKAEGQERKMFSSDISESGLFIRTNKGFPPGTALDLKLYLPDESIAYAKGWVKRTVKTQVSAFKNGMGVKLLEADENFKRFFEIEFEEPFSATPVKNIIPRPATPVQEKVLPKPPEPSHAAPQSPPQTSSSNDDFVIVRCTSCNVKNKVMRSKVSLRPKCGKCGVVLQV